jgi:8-oxo-dGTP pyrophosphatase MutT (NUDIX family)
MSATVPLGDLPEWIHPLITAIDAIDDSAFAQLPNRVVSETDAANYRAAAVLMLFGDGPHGPDVLLLRRAEDMTAHPGQVAFPGGAAEPTDHDPIDTALREACEETGLRSDGVWPLAVLPAISVPVSGFAVSPVLAYWLQPHMVTAVDPAETAAVARIPIAQLADPANRFRVRMPSGHIGPAFQAPDMMSWGFTGGLLAMLLRLGGWERPWDTTDVRDLTLCA